MKKLQLSDAYRSAIITAIILQTFLVLLMILMLDGGSLAKIGGYAMTAFWLGTGVIMFRRPLTPRVSDLVYIKWGYPFFLLIGVGIAMSVAALHHH
jgi:hypothetical protein